MHLYSYSPKAQSQCLSGHYSLYSEQHSLSFIQLRKTPQEKTPQKTLAVGEENGRGTEGGDLTLWMDGNATENLENSTFNINEVCGSNRLTEQARAPPGCVQAAQPPGRGRATQDA